AVNAKGVFLGTRAAIPAMRRAGGGSIVNISSQLGLVGMEESSPQYSASKGAVRLLTKLTALQYARDAIRANSVHPGPIVTPMTERRRSDPAQYQRMLASALQYARDAIRANSVHPGPLVTPMTERRRSDPAQYQRMLARIPLGRYGQPDEVAYGVLYLASDESAFVTGSELVIDGGWTAQ